MHAYATLGMLALAGSALAAPAPRWGGNHDGGNPQVVYETAVVTVIVGPNGRPFGGPAPTPAPDAPQQPPPAEPTSLVVEAPPQSHIPEQPSPPPAPAPTSPAEPPPAPSSEYTPEPTAAPAPSNPSTGTYMDVVSTWRSKLGLPALEHDSTLEANALKTCNDGNGEMKHELNPGTFGQVLAPGQPDEFERCFVGGWLCERPDMPGMDGICATMSKGWAYNQQTGHADILSSKDYTKIGCANAGGIWGCDVA